MRQCDLRYASRTKIGKQGKNSAKFGQHQLWVGEISKLIDSFTDVTCDKTSSSQPNYLSIKDKTVFKAKIKKSRFLNKKNLKKIRQTNFDEFRDITICLKIGDILTDMLDPALRNFLVFKEMVDYNSILDVYGNIKMMTQKYQEDSSFLPCGYRYAKRTKNDKHCKK